jgi:hypothetical protein
LKSKLLLFILAMVSAACMPLAATSQIAPDRPARTEPTDPTYKWEAFAGYGYTSLNQVNQSRYGLQGVNLSLTRDWGKYFGLTADGAFYSMPIASGDPGNPTVDTVLFGPVLRVPMFKNIDGFVHGLLGGEHSGGESQTPNISFAGGFGGGMEYKLNARISLRASGDDIIASFSPINNTKILAYSPHMTRNPRAAIGVVYRF